MRTKVIRMEKAWARFAGLALIPLGGALFQGCGVSVWMGEQGGGGEDRLVPPADGLMIDPDNLRLPDGLVGPDDFQNPGDRIHIDGEA